MIRLLVGLMMAYVEGSWEDVMRLIGQAHCMLHEKGIVRIQTDIRVGSRYVFDTTELFFVGKCAELRNRTDKKQTFSDKVKAVNDILAADGKSRD